MKARGLDALLAARRRWAWLRRAVLGLVLLLAGYVGLGLIPVNRGFVPTPGGVRVYLVSNAVHTDVVVPIRAAGGAAADWRAFLGEAAFAAGWPASATHVAIGWGDRGFFLETPAWSDLRPGTAVRALLWPSESCVHVSLARPEAAGALLPSVRLSDDQYRALTRYLRGSFAAAAGGGPEVIAGAAYGEYDAFYRGRGRYHAAHNCNHWAGAALRAAGVRVPWYTPLPGTMLWYLPG